MDDIFDGLLSHAARRIARRFAAVLVVIAAAMAIWAPGVFKAGFEAIVNWQTDRIERRIERVRTRVPATPPTTSSSVMEAEAETTLPEPHR